MSKPINKSFELNLEELGGLNLEDIKCRACSGYGNCGFRQYCMKDGKPVLICQARKKELLGEDGGATFNGQ